MTTQAQHQTTGKTPLTNLAGAPAPPSPQKKIQALSRGGCAAVSLSGRCHSSRQSACKACASCKCVKVHDLSTCCCLPYRAPGQPVGRQRVHAGARSHQLGGARMERMHRCCPVLCLACESGRIGVLGPEWPRSARRSGASARPWLRLRRVRVCASIRQFCLVQLSALGSALLCALVWL